MRRKMKKPPKLNLIPILDAIFIFIFFLLMSAQFIDIYEIGSDAPITSTSSPEMKKEPLNLTIVLSGEDVIVKTGLDENIYKKYKVSQLDQLNEGLIELKKLHPTEDSAILKPSSSFQYEKIVKVIDSTREIKKTECFCNSGRQRKQEICNKKAV